MDYSKLEKNENSIRFEIKNIDKSILNGIRRIILSEIPMIAFNDKDINIITNTNDFHNEFIANRISLIPPHFTENETYNFKKENYTFKISKKNNTNDTIKVTSKDIKIYDINNKLIDDNFRERIFPSNKITKDYILITKLKPNKYNIENGQELDITFKASVDIAKKHARWAPVSQSVFYNSYDENDKDIIKSQRNFKKNQYDEPIEFVFMIETECGLRSEYLFYKAYNIIYDKLNLLIKNINEKNKVKIEKLGEIDNFYQIGIMGEDYTLIEIIQSLIYNKYFRSSEGSSDNSILEYIGYYINHPDANTIFIKLKFSKNIDISKFMIDNIEDIKKIIEKYKTKWVEFSKLNTFGINNITV
jgi:DNA-directed RNA polymerase subunit L